MRTLTVLLFGAVFVAGGCGSVKPPIEPRAEVYASKQIYVDDEDLRRSTTIGPPNVSKDQYGHLFITCPVRSASNYNLNIEWKATYFSPEGRVLWETPWTRLYLQRNTPETLQTNSPVTGVADFQLSFKWGDVKYTR